MYKANGEQCKKCGKLFRPDARPDAKVFRPIDSNGNPLEIELCDMCEWDNMVEDVMKARHISHKEAEKFIYDKMHTTLLDAEMLELLKPQNNDDMVEYHNPWSRSELSMLKVTERTDGIVRMVKNNE